MKEKKHFTADEKCEAEKKYEEMRQWEMGVQMPFTKAVFNPAFALLTHCFYIARELTILEGTGERKDVKIEK